MSGYRAQVAVVGGGLAGITAALSAADAGAAVILYEARRELGGLTRSFVRNGPAGRLEVDSGQHVFLGCCTAYRRLIRRLDAEPLVALQPRLDVPMIGADRAARLHADRLPPPLHLARSMIGFGWLSWSERARVATALSALGDLDPNDPASDAQTFGQWLRDHGQSERAIALLWDLIGLPTLNARADVASLALAAIVFRTGLLTSRDASAIGWPLAPLRRLHHDAAAAALDTADVELRTRTAITDLDHLSEADRVIIATPPPIAERLLPAGAIDRTPGWANRLGAVPILNLHFIFDRTVTEEKMLAAVGSPLQWIFDRTRPAGLHSGQYLAISLSGADDLVGLPAAELRARFEPELHRLLPASSGARVIDYFVTRERQATFQPAPGQATLRPEAVTRDPRLVLAGAWTATGWPATMEGAVLSGELAARIVLEQDHQQEQQQQDHRAVDPPRSALARSADEVAV